MANLELGNLVWKITGDTSGLQKNIKKSEQDTKGFTGTLKKLGGVIATTFAVQKIIAFGKEILGLASDAEETGNKFAVTFQGIDRASQAAIDLAKNYGLSRKASQELLSGTGDLLTGFGFFIIDGYW